MSAPQDGDKSAGFSGLILGGIAIFVIVFAIVRLTNAKYAGEEVQAHAAPAASAPATTAPDAKASDAIAPAATAPASTAPAAH